MERWMKSFAKISLGTAQVIGILGIFSLFGSFILTLVGKGEPVIWLGISLALFSVTVGCLSIHSSDKSDVKYTKLLERLDKNVSRLPTLIKDDILTPPGQLIAKDMLSEQSKDTAQKRLDADTKEVGYVRGELFQKEDGSWAIAWGGKYPL